MKNSIGLTDENSQAIAFELSKILADEQILSIKTRNAHWNVVGSDFYEKHLFFDIQYHELDEIIDTVAERIRFIGHYPPSTLAMYVELTHLTEMNREKNDSNGFIQELVSDHNHIIIELRKNISHFVDDLKDAGSSDFITGLMEKHEKMVWILRSHLL